MNDWYWIGLSDSASEGTWRWLNGNRANTDDDSLWAPGTPRTGSSGNNRDCAFAVFGPGRIDGSFVCDDSCGSNHKALCEKPV